MEVQEQISVKQKSISSFNAKKQPCFNENWNKAHGIHSMFEDALFRTVQWADSGIMRKPISRKKVLEYIELYPEYIQSLLEHYKFIAQGE